MTGPEEALSERLAEYVARRLGSADPVRVEGLERIFGGASRETYRLRLHWREGGEARSRRVILRRDPPGSLIETERAVEFAAYRGFHGTAVPVPEPLWLEEDPRWLDHPFFVMEEVTGEGLEASPQRVLAPPYADHAEAIARQKWTILGEISKSDPALLGVLGPMEPVERDACWRRELDFWEARLDEDEPCPQPIVRAAIRWLRRNPPPPAQKLSVVHADFRTGNFLVDPGGTIRAILDWEMAHLGDPLEDLAWGINPVWRWGTPLAGGLAPRERAIALWEEASGLRADPDALRWWELFSSVKGQAIWVSGAKEFAQGRNQDLVLGLSGWLMGNSQDRACLHDLGRLA